MDQTFTILTTLLTGRDAGHGRGNRIAICGAGHPRSSPPATAIVVGLNWEDVVLAKYRSNYA